MVSLATEAQELWACKSDGGHRHADEPWLVKYAEEVLVMAPNGGVLVDVGCGACELTTHLAPHFSRVYAVDFSDSMLAAARTRVLGLGLENVCILPGDMRRLPSEIPAADVVLSFGVIQFLSLEETEEHLRQCAKVLAPGGVVVIANVPDKARRDWYCHNVMAPRPGGRLGGLRQWVAVNRRRLSARFRGKAIWDDVGNWFSIDELAEAARRGGFEIETRNAWYYEYRFHASLRLSKRR